MPRNRGKFGALFKKVFIAGLVTRAAKLLLLAGVCFVFIINEVYSSKDLFVTESNMNFVRTSINLRAVMKLLFTTATQGVRKKSRGQ